MKSIINLLMATSFVLSITSCGSQIKNPTTETVKIYGNCGMCEEKIETAGTVKKISKVDWDVDSKMATITFDSKKTNLDKILKSIALVGYDSDKFLAPDEVYANLHGCCQYDRVNKNTATSYPEMEDHSTHDHDNMASDTDQKTSDETKEDVSVIGQLDKMYSLYFDLKNALVESKKEKATASAAEMIKEFNKIEMSKMPMDEHMVWMKEMAGLKKNLEKFNTAKTIEIQRSVFMTLSVSMHTLMEASTLNNPVYYQFCPMANDGKGANWLSEEKEIKNPYYGSQMLTCGKTVETLNK